MTWYRDEW